jgi:hypothetical protein
MGQQHSVILLSGIISAVIGLVAGFIGGRLAPYPSLTLTPGPPPASAALLQAQTFKLVDQAGHERGVWGIDADGATRLALFGPEAALPLVNLAVSPRGGATLQLSDSRSTRAVVLKTEPGGSRGVSLYSGDKIRLKLEVQKNGEPAVNLYDKGSRLIALGLTHQGDPYLTFYGEGQKAALEITSKKNGDRSLDLMGKNGMPRVVLGLKNDKKAALGLFDRQGKTRVALLDEPSLILLKGGKPVRTLP